ncbi:STAS-like domain-containing protein [Cognatishimia activa]|uniref:STAS-like domain-containing protein n=1 Tax=Cognatishimia activa TaxID=1715691 RepID=UPI002232BBDE|nr:STAS-like domain-containing protein [Cognatishimia activa]UZD90331.1 STAS-like domain-containing protein [Cognatishimia activa]
MDQLINIAEDYTEFPGGRYVEDGDGNGTTFREEYLLPAMKRNDDDVVSVILDGAAGYPSSFLEEAFGGLVREHDFTPEDVLKRFKFIANEPGFSRYVALIEQYVTQAQRKDT